MTSVLARYLKDFGAGDGPRTATRQPAQADAMTQPPDMAPAIDIDAVRQAAYEDGRQAAQAAMRAGHEQALSELVARHEDEISGLKSRYQAELAEAIARRFDTMRAELGREIGRQAAEVFAPFVETAVRDAMVQRFAEAIVDALGDSASTKVTVCGPAYLFGFLESLPALASLELEHVEADDVDLSAEINGSLLATRLKALTESLPEGAR